MLALRKLLASSFDAKSQDAQGGNPRIRQEGSDEQAGTSRLSLAPKRKPSWHYFASESGGRLRKTELVPVSDEQEFISLRNL